MLAREVLVAGIFAKVTFHSTVLFKSSCFTSLLLPNAHNFLGITKDIKLNVFTFVCNIERN
jgi:hypothetical protein